MCRVQLIEDWCFDRNKATTLDVAGFVNSDYASDLDKRRSIFGYIFTMFVAAIS